MKLLAVVRAPPQAEPAASAVAAAMGLTLAEARTRLAPEPPALLARVEDAAADALAASLRAAGLAALAIGARVPGDPDRIVAQKVAFSPRAVAFSPRGGETMEVAWEDVVAVLRGARESRTDVERSEKTRSLSLGMAIATGGLKVTSTTTRTSRSSETAIQQVIVLYSRDGRAAALVEGVVAFACLGPDLQPSSTANMATLARKLREGAPRAFHDDRLLRLGRRPLSLLAGGESRSASGGVVSTTRDTASSFDVLAELLHQAVVQGLLP